MCLCEFNFEDRSSLHNDSHLSSDRTAIVRSRTREWSSTYVYYYLGIRFRLNNSIVIDGV